LPLFAFQVIANLIGSGLPYVNVRSTF
jgi:hypothetical protein